MKRYFIMMVAVLSLLIGSTGRTQAQSDRQFIRSGNKLYRQQNYAKAEAEYLKALQKNSRNPQALYNLGCALMMQQKDSAAIVQYQRAGEIETSPLRKAKVYHNIGVICQGRRLYGDAIKAYEESLRNNPNDNETRYNLALCKRLQKQQKQQPKPNPKNKNNKDKNKDKNNEQNNKDKKQNQNQKQMSRDNAEQLLNAAMQEEQATQQRLKKAMQQPQSRRLQKNW